MPDITSQERFIALQWKRGKGYFNAHEHKRPWLWESFNEALKAREPYCDRRMRSRRYRAYLLSWSLHHVGQLLAWSDVSTDKDRGEKILERLRISAANEVTLRKEMKSGKGKPAKARGKKGDVR